MITYNRSRIVYGALIIIVVLMGLGSRRFPEFLPGYISNYAGDTLWALMVFLCAGFLFKNWPVLKVGTASIIFSFLIEISQLYHSPFTDMVRRTRLGGLVLGFGFLWSDLICYTVGIIFGAILDKSIAIIQKNKLHE